MEVRRDAYRLTFPEGRPFVHLEDGAGRAVSALFLGSSLHAVGGLDETYALEPPVLADDGAVVTVEAKSSVWRNKRLVLRCHDTLLEAWVEVEGDGALTDCHLFGGYYSGQLRWGSGFFQSGARHSAVWSPEPWQSERRELPPAESSTIDVLGTSLPGKGHWFFTPAPFCYGLRGEDGRWTMVGLGARLEAQTFTGFHYDAVEGAYSLRLAYEGQTHVRGAFRTPSVLFAFDAPDAYAGLERYVAALRGLGFLGAQPAPLRPAWWSEPIFCGWGAQCSLANVAARQGEQVAGAPVFSRQVHYDRFLETLASHGLVPGTVVLDDKWQCDYGTNEVDTEKWPDLLGWIARRHAAGQHVLLWWKAWDPEGLPPEHCVRNVAGTVVAADPSNPAYEATLRASVQRMLGPRAAGGYDADGFKVDFSARTPSGPGLIRHGSQWGVSLLHRLLWILYDEAKRVKPDALVMTHTPNPHFGDVTDMIRLNDVNTGADVVAQMRHRAAVARAACPDVLIDTDNWPMPSKAAWREYVQVQPELGVPSLYFATHVDSGEALTEQDYAAVRECWEEWRRRVNRSAGGR